jgi:hypothetical protein
MDSAPGMDVFRKGTHAALAPKLKVVKGAELALHVVLLLNKPK